MSDRMLKFLATGLLAYVLASYLQLILAWLPVFLNPHIVVGFDKASFLGGGLKLIAVAPFVMFGAILFTCAVTAVPALLMEGDHAEQLRMIWIFMGLFALNYIACFFIARLLLNKVLRKLGWSSQEQNSSQSKVA